MSARVRDGQVRDREKRSSTWDGGNIGESVSSARSANHTPTPARPARLFLISRAWHAAVSLVARLARSGRGCRVGELSPVGVV